MYKNLGKKMQSFASALCIGGIILSCVAGFFQIFTVKGSFFRGLMIMVLGSLGAWIGSWGLYGFGIIVNHYEKLDSDNVTQSRRPAEHAVVTTNNNEQKRPTEYSDNLLRLKRSAFYADMDHSKSAEEIAKAWDESGLKGQFQDVTGIIEEYMIKEETFGTGYRITHLNALKRKIEETLNSQSR